MPSFGPLVALPMPCRSSLLSRGCGNRGPRLRRVLLCMESSPRLCDSTRVERLPKLGQQGAHPVPVNPHLIGQRNRLCVRNNALQLLDDLGSGSHAEHIGACGMRLKRESSRFERERLATTCRAGATRCTSAKRGKEPEQDQDHDRDPARDRMSMRPRREPQKRRQEGNRRNGPPDPRSRRRVLAHQGESTRSNAWLPMRRCAFGREAS